MTTDKEEKELVSSFEGGEWTPVRDREQEIARLTKMARTAARKNKRINIRLSDGDLTRIKEIAEREGIPYQTLIASVLHKYGTGLLTETHRTA
jgi:predicted DNA binding CopG/RHH family protein